MDAKGVLKFLKLEGLIEHLSGYIEDRISLLKIELQEDIVSIGTKLLLVGVMLMLALFCLLFISIAMAIMLNLVLGHAYFGYLIVGGGYLICTLIAFALKDNQQIKRVLYKAIGKSFDK
jgi:hypothetical protein